MLVLPELYGISVLRVTLVFLAKTNYIPSSFRMAGVCPYFCHTYFCVERVKLIRPKDTVGQYLGQNQSREAGLVCWICGRKTWYYAGWTSLVVLVWVELQCSLVVAQAVSCSEEALPAWMASDRMVESVLLPLPFLQLFTCSLLHLVLSSCPRSSRPLWLHKLPVPWSLLALSMSRARRRGAALLSLGWFFLLSLCACRGSVCCLIDSFFFFFRAADGVTAPTWSGSAFFW